MEEDISTSVPSMWIKAFRGKFRLTFSYNLHVIFLCQRPRVLPMHRLAALG